MYQSILEKMRDKQVVRMRIDEQSVIEIIERHYERQHGRITTDDIKKLLKQFMEKVEANNEERNRELFVRQDHDKSG